MIDKIIGNLDWIVVQARLAHCREIADGILNYPDDPRRDDAEKILETIAQIRRARKRGRTITAQMEQLRRLTEAANWKILGPHLNRSAKILDSAERGHEAVYGTDEEKAENWQAIYSDYLAALSNGHNKTGAYSVVAEQHGISTKTVQRAVKRIATKS